MNTAMEDITTTMTTKGKEDITIANMNETKCGAGIASTTIICHLALPSEINCRPGWNGNYEFGERFHRDYGKK